MPSKLSCHWQRTRPSQEDDRWLSQWRPLHIKLIVGADNDIPGLDTALKYVHPKGRVIVRHHPLSENYGRRALPDDATTIAIAKQHAGFIVNTLWPIARDRYRARPDQLLWTGLNEPQVWSTEPPEQTALYYQVFLDELHKAGLNGMVLNFGVGWPGNGGIKDAPPIWTPYERVRRAMIAGDVLGLHEYHPMAGPQYAWRWLCGRYLQCPWDVPIIIGECGLDDAVAPGVRHLEGEGDVGVAAAPAEWEIDDYVTFMAARHDPDVRAARLNHLGFHGLSPNFEQACRIYMEHLKWYDAELGKDQRVLSAMPFTYDFSHPWATFNVRERTFMEQFLLPYIASQGGIWTPEAAPAPPPAPSIPVIDINGRLRDETWLRNETGIVIDRSLRRAGGTNWVITGLRAVKQRNYTVIVRTGSAPRTVGRYHPNASNNWPGGVKPPDVPAPPEAATRAELIVVPSGGFSQAVFPARAEDFVAPKKGVNKFWISAAGEGTDVLSGMGIFMPDMICYVPTFEPVEIAGPAPPVPPLSLKEAVMRWEDLVKKHCGSFDPRLFLTIIAVESGGNPNAINSQSKATGLGQIMPREAGGAFANRPTQAELLDPETNIQWMVKIYSGNYERYKNSTFPLERALCAYYGGTPLGNNLLANDSLVYLRAFMRRWQVLFTDPCIIRLPDKSASEYQLTLSQGVWYVEEAVRQIEAAQQGGNVAPLLSRARDLLVKEALPRLIKLRDL
jgi:hypothetical protein